VALWAAHGPAAHRLEIRRLCFRAPEVTDWATIEVHGDSIVAVTFLDGTPAPARSWSARPSVSGLFGLLNGLDARWEASVTANNDAQYDYPTRIALQRKKNIPDAGLTLKARNLAALTPPARSAPSSWGK
jgi:hypothetical protein